jgi:peptidoglycan/LPS O-acetylase OafA/YrhL
VLSERFDSRANALNTLRLVFATAVIVAHSYPIGGFGDPPQLGDLDPGGFAVAAFFVASGYLISESRQRNTLPRFFWARFLRIYPGFWVCLIVTAFVFAPIAGLVRGGWTMSDGLSYVASNSSLGMAQFAIGDTLAGAPYPAAWDGSLWTLKYEFGCYVLIGLFLSVPRFRRGWWALGMLALSSAAGVLRHFGALGDLHAEPSTSAMLELSNWALLVPFFVAGAVIHRYRQSIPMSPIFFVISALLIAASAAAGWALVIAPLPLAYCVMWLGAKLPQMIERVGDGTLDISYGMYIYAFPMQQLLVLAGVRHLGVAAMISASVVVTTVPAAVSWFAVERRCLRFKSIPWAPRRLSARPPRLDAKVPSADATLNVSHDSIGGAAAENACP